jgi:hypothetical protein
LELTLTAPPESTVRLLVTTRFIIPVPDECCKVPVFWTVRLVRVKEVEEVRFWNSKVAPDPMVKSARAEKVPF